jgi:hypothetical protein
MRVLVLLSGLVLVAGLLFAAQPSIVADATGVSTRFFEIGKSSWRSWATGVRRSVGSVRALLGLRTLPAASEGPADSSFAVEAPSEHISPTKDEADELFELINSFSPPLSAVINRLQGTLGSGEGSMKISTDKLFQRSLIQYLMSGAIVEADIRKKKTKKEDKKKQGDSFRKNIDSEGDEEDDSTSAAREAQQKRGRMLRHKAAFLIQAFKMDFSDRDSPDVLYKAAVMRYLRRALFQ